MRTWAIGIFAAAALALAATVVPQTASAQQESTNVRLTYLQTRAAIFDTLAAQQQFSVARAERNEMAQRAAAAQMLANLSLADVLTMRLDEAVTASAYSQEIDQNVADLHDIVTTALDTMDEALMGNDLAMIGQRLDESGDVFNRLSNNIRAVDNTLFPQLNPRVPAAQ
jgi:hypothetical protein